MPGEQLVPGAFRCNAWLPADHRRQNRSFRDHPVVGVDWRRSEQAGPRRHKPLDRRGGGICPRRRRRRGRTCGTAGLG